MNIIKAGYSIDYNSIDAVCDNGILIRALCEYAEAKIKTTLQSQSKLVWLR